MRWMAARAVRRGCVRAVHRARSTCPGCMRATGELVAAGGTVARAGGHLREPHPWRGRAPVPRGGRGDRDRPPSGGARARQPSQVRVRARLGPRGRAPARFHGDGRRHRRPVPLRGLGLRRWRRCCRRGRRWTRSRRSGRPGRRALLAGRSRRAKATVPVLGRRGRMGPDRDRGDGRSGVERLDMAAIAPNGGATGRRVHPLLIEEPHTACIGHAMAEEDVRAILADPDVLVASDASAMSPTGRRLAARPSPQLRHVPARSRPLRARAAC